MPSPLQANSAKNCQTKSVYIRRNKHGRRADELQFAPLYGHHRQETVDKVNGKEQRLAVQVVLIGNFDQPVDEDRSHIRCNVCLTLHVIGSRTIAKLFTQHT